MTRRLILLSLLLNALLYVGLLLYLISEPWLAESHASFAIVPILPLLLGFYIFGANDISEFILSLICLTVSINTALWILFSVVKYRRKIFFLFAHGSLILFWGLSLAVLIMLK